MSVPKITITRTQTPALSSDAYSNLPPRQENNRLKVTPEPSIYSAPDDSEEQKPEDDFDPSIGAKPYSPFYRHHTAQTTKVRSLEVRSRRDTTNESQHINDIELGQESNTNPHNENTKKFPFSLLELVSRRKTIRRSNLWAQDNREGSCLRGLSEKQRLAVKLIIALITLGGMIGIALGITVAVGGGVWAGRRRVSPIGGGS